MPLTDDMKPAAPAAVVVRLAAGASFWRLLSIVVTALVPGLCRAADFSGASATFTSDDPVVAAALALVDGGDLADAERMLVAASGDGAYVDAAARAEFLEVARRVRYDYALDEAALVAMVREFVPDATADEVAAWAAEAKLASRLIDGRRLLHRRAAQNLFLFSPGARGRRDSVTPPPPATWSLVDHTKAVVAEAIRTGSTCVLPMRFRITHTITVPMDHATIRPGSIRDLHG